MDFKISQTLPNRMMFGSLRPSAEQQNIPKLNLDSIAESAEKNNSPETTDDIYFASVRDEVILGQRDPNSSNKSLYVKLHDDNGKTVRRFNLRKYRESFESECKLRETPKTGTSILETMERYLQNNPGAKTVRFFDSSNTILTPDTPVEEDIEDDDSSIDDDGFEQ